MEKLCWFCKHFNYEAPTADHSEVTGGDPSSISCGKYVFYIYDPSEIEYAAAVTLAEKCKGFEVNEEIKKKIEDKKKENIEKFKNRKEYESSF